MKYLQIKFLDSETELFKGMAKRAIDLDITMTDYVKGLLKKDLETEKVELEEKKITGKFDPEGLYSKPDIAKIIGVDRSQLYRKYGELLKANDIKPNKDGKFSGSDLIRVFS